jgi:hypothetical protein
MSSPTSRCARRRYQPTTGDEFPFEGASLGHPHVCSFQFSVSRRSAGRGAVLIYEGHDEPKRKGVSDPKSLDQPEWQVGGTLTENGKFHQAAQQFKAGRKGPDIVQVYEKIKSGIWTDNGFFHLVDSWIENDGTRNVFKFKLVAVESVSDESAAEESVSRFVDRSRIIPTSVKLEVWARDGGKCVTCGATDELHFDHVLPFSKGGTSLKAENIQLLCARHNLSKSAKIQ